MINILFSALFFLNSVYNQFYIHNLASSAFVHTKCIFACWHVSPKPSESIRNLIKLPVCFHPFITPTLFSQVIKPFALS